MIFDVVGTAYEAGAKSALVEYRYVDSDYRSEHSHFYSTTFRRYPSVAHRIHFFSEPPPEDLADAKYFAELSHLKESYLGYSVLRPVPGARVGRTMLSPPDRVSGDIACVARDHVNVFGIPMSVLASPFMAQDAQLGVCAHMALWVSAYYHHLAFGSQRLTVADVSQVIPQELGIGRAIPSRGLNIEQISAACQRMGIPAVVYRCRRAEDLPAGESIPRIACRYLNSGMPVIVGAGGRHTFVLVGYTRVDAMTTDERILFYAQDDERGAYRVVDDFAHDVHGSWDWLIVPLPEKVFLLGEVAESLGKERLIDTAKDQGTPELFEERVSFRSTALRSNQFKEFLEARDFKPEIFARYRRMQLPRWVWVVEAIRRQERADRAPAVMAEAVIDATDHSRDLNVLAWRVGSALWSWRPDDETVGVADVGQQGLVRSVSQYVGNEPLPQPAN